MNAPKARIITVTLNPAIDFIYEVPGLRLGAHLKGKMRARIPAGKGINVARALGLLGSSCVAVGFIGEDERLLFHDALSRRNIAPRFIPVAGHTRANITLIDPTERIETHIRDAGFRVSQSDLMRMRKLLADLARPGDVVCFAGSLPEGMSGGDLSQLVKSCCDAGCKVGVDTGGAVLAELRGECVWFAKPNRHEIAEMVGQKLDLDADLIRVGGDMLGNVSELLLSLGADGAVLFCEGAVLRGKAESPGGIVSTVGCGDALVAGYIGARVSGASPKDALPQAIGVATASAMQDTPAEFDPAEARRIADRVTLTRLGS
jgi:1-phosphofructokinase family hexose kinase